ncbi:MAG TPA: lytic transglycosylase domain-containing protein [Terriglobales bacterium]|nr:lytic transglycosylase domain-containing protein [Terriglobales bacterium]
MKILNYLAKLGVFLVLLLAPIWLHAADIARLRNGFEIRHEQREVSGANTRLFLSVDRTGGYVDVPTGEIVSFERDESVRAADQKLPSPQTGPRTANTAPEQAVDVHAIVETAARSHSLDPDFIASVIRAESSFNQKAISSKGAQGLMQLMPGTALELGVKDSFDPQANVDGGTRYLRELLLRYNDDVAKALAAYNAGPKRVDQYRGIPPYSETRKYVARIIREYNRKKLAAKSVRKAPPKKTKTKVAAAAAPPASNAVGS